MPRICSIYASSAGRIDGNILRMGKQKSADKSQILYPLLQESTKIILTFYFQKRYLWKPSSPKLQQKLVVEQLGQSIYQNVLRCRCQRIHYIPAWHPMKMKIGHCYPCAISKIRLVKEQIKRHRLKYHCLLSSRTTLSLLRSKLYNPTNLSPVTRK